MALKIIDHGTVEYEQMVKLRDEILRQPLGLSFTKEELEKAREKRREEFRNRPRNNDDQPRERRRPRAENEEEKKEE